MLDDKINSLISQALINKETDRLSYLRYLKSLIQDYKVNNNLDRQSPLNDDLVEVILARELKKTQENLNYAKQTNNSLLIQKCLQEIDLLNQFLPKKMTEQEIKTIINQVIHGLEQNKIALNQGLIIKTVIEKTGLQADKSLVASMVRERLL